MRYIYNNLKAPLSALDTPPAVLLARALRIAPREIVDCHVAKQSVDARHKARIVISYNLVFSCERALPEGDPNLRVCDDTPAAPATPAWPFAERPVVVGFGPAGIFAALHLARCGARPVVLERGGCIEDRIADVERYLSTRELNEESNVQFGEGGAGTFSDGKLTTNLRDPLIRFILEEFVKHGAPEEILWESLPHVGTDYLRDVVRNLRLEMQDLGAEFHFRTRFDDFTSAANDPALLDVHATNTATGDTFTFRTRHLLLGTGHSARDTLTMLHARGVAMEPKSFSVGVRIEHKAADINRTQYGPAANRLPPATYKMAVHLADRDVYTFCMCPGGQVMASASERGTIVVNGMSNHDRGMENSNAALLVNVTPDDYLHATSPSPLDGLAWQAQWEKKAYEIAADGRAPANLCREFLAGTVARDIRSVRPSYPQGVFLADLARCLPDFAVRALREALPLFGRKMRGFDGPDAVLTGVETRSSCPVRIPRDDTRAAPAHPAIYPIGEGAGWAGGITSAALDGLKTAIAIVDRSLT